MAQSFTQTFKEGIFTENESLPAQFLTLDGCTRQVIGFVFAEKVPDSPTLCGTTRVSYCRVMPSAKPLTVLDARFVMYEELCSNEEALIIKELENGIEEQINATDEDLTDSLTVEFLPEDTANLPEELAFRFEITTEEFGRRVWAWGSVLVRPCAPDTLRDCS